VKAQELSKKYATAIFSLALEQWLAALSTVQEKLANDTDLTAKLGNSGLSFAERQEALDKIIPSDSDQSIRNFLYTLLKNGDTALLGDVLVDLGQMSKGGALTEIAEVTTAVTLSTEEKENFRQKLQARYGATLEVVFNVNPAILGGAIVQVGDKLIDGSVQTRLEAMKNTLGVKL
jgi:F-type H+-transporting ATPase subunit delta